MPKLIVKRQFNNAGVEYRPGESFDLLDAAKWPSGTLERRIEHGFVSFRPDEDDEPQSEAEAHASRGRRRQQAVEAAQS